jgi:hypothetical protein
MVDGAVDTAATGDNRTQVDDCLSALSHHDGQYGLRDKEHGLEIS